MDESTVASNNSVTSATEVAQAAAAAAAAVAAQVTAAAHGGSQGGTPETPVVPHGATGGPPSHNPHEPHTNGDRESASVSPPVGAGSTVPSAAAQANMLHNSTKLYEEAAAASAAAAGLTSLGKFLFSNLFNLVQIGVILSNLVTSCPNW